MTYDEKTLDSVFCLLDDLHYQHEYKGKEKEAVDETIEYIKECVAEMKKKS